MPKAAERPRCGVANVVNKSDPPYKYHTFRYLAIVSYRLLQNTTVEYLLGALYIIHTNRNWADTGQIQCIRADRSGSKRLCRINDIQSLLGAHTGVAIQKKEKVAYARVSSQAQKADLDRQIEDFEGLFPHHRIISDIGSGLNFKRKGFLSLVDSAIGGNVEEVAAMHRGRLCRFGIDLLEHLFRKAGVKFVIHNGSEEEACHTTGASTELAEDLIAVTTFFTCRQNGRRAAANRKRRRVQQSAPEPENHAIPDLSNEETGANAAQMDGHRSMDLQ